MNKPLILVVEDDPPVRNLITTTLRTNDYRYLVAANGEAAIVEASSHNPDIVLLDLGLPDMDGIQVIINLVDNAIKYTQPGSNIEIHSAQQGKWVVVSVSDDGPGIDDSQKPKVFDMFYSGANKIADSRRSLGLGLSLCRSIVNAHGGTISVADNAPHGAVFTFTLPAGEVELNE